MSNYTYTDEGGDKLGMHSFGFERVHVIAQSKSGRVVPVHIANADAPTVALELLKAAGQESVIVPKAYEEVIRNGAEITCGSGPEKAYGAVSQNPNWLYNRAANYVALAQWIEASAAREAAEKAEAEAIEKKLQERRDAVLKETGIHDSYESLGPNAPMRKAVDRIIELQDEAAK